MSAAPAPLGRAGAARLPADRGPAAAVRGLPRHADPGPWLPAVRRAARADRRGGARPGDRAGDRPGAEVGARRRAGDPLRRAAVRRPRGAQRATWTRSRRPGTPSSRASGPGAADQLRPRILYDDVIEDVTDQHAVIINRNREASMLLPGDTLLVLRDDAGAVRGGRRQRGRARCPGQHARRRVDDRRGGSGVHQRHPRGGRPRLERRSGGCSRPCRAAPTEARGPWVRDTRAVWPVSRCSPATRCATTASARTRP